MRLTARFAAPLLALVAFAAPATVPAAHAAHVPAPTVAHLPTNTLTPGPGVNLTSVQASALGVINRYQDGTSYTLSNGTESIDFVFGNSTSIPLGETAVPRTMPTTPTTPANPAASLWTITSSSNATLTNIAFVVVV